MRIEIVEMDLRKGLFLVKAPQTGEQIKVTGYQLVHSLTCTNECTNARLHQTGLFIKTPSGEIIKYNVRPIDAKLKVAIKKYFIAHPEQLLSQTKKEEAKQTAKPVTQIENRVDNKQITKSSNEVIKKKPVASVNNPNESVTNNNIIKRQISDTKDRFKEEHLKIYYMGTLFNSAKEICKKYGCDDIDNFTRLYKLGYPMQMCLGKEPFDPNLKVVPREKQFDAYLRTVGQYN